MSKTNCSLGIPFIGPIGLAMYSIENLTREPFIEELIKRHPLNQENSIQVFL